MRLSQPPCCRKIPACLDYDAYVFDLPGDLAAMQLSGVRKGLERLGRVDREELGVVYIRGDWGHLVLPPPGFPELKVVFHRGTPVRSRQRILELTAAAIAASQLDWPN
jgi:hypothetical protein